MIDLGSDLLDWLCTNMSQGTESISHAGLHDIAVYTNTEPARRNHENVVRL